MSNLCPVVIAGPSGVGKGTLVKMLMDKYPANFGFSVSHTTRAPRPGEVDGVHYNFVEKAAMQTAIDNNEFIEHANVHTNIYGTSVAAVEKVKAEGKVRVRIYIYIHICTSCSTLRILCFLLELRLTSFQSIHILLHMHIHLHRYAS